MIPKSVIKIIFVILFFGFYSYGQIKVGFNADWPPYSYLDKDGTAKGHLVDHIAKILKQAKVDYQFIALPWKRVQFMVASGELDAMVTVGTPERLTYSLPSQKVIYTVEMKAFVNLENPKLADLKKLTQIQDFKKYKVCDLIGNGWAEQTYKKAGVEVVFLPTTESCVKQVFYGFADIMMIAELAGLDLVEKNGFKNKISTVDTVFDKMEFVFLVSKKSKYQDILKKL